MELDDLDDELDEALRNQMQPASTLTTFDPTDVPPALILDYALAIDNEDTISRRHGYSPSQLKQLKTMKWFNDRVAWVKRDLEESGFTFRGKAAMLAEDLMVDVYRAAKLSDSVASKLDVAKYLAKMADLEPRGNVDVNQGNSSGFSIVINLDASRDAAKIQKVIDAEALAETPLLPEPPEYLKSVG